MHCSLITVHQTTPHSLINLTKAKARAERSKRGLESEACLTCPRDARIPKGQLDEMVNLDSKSGWFLEMNDTDRESQH
ncbi:hypothetical protein JTE90_027413 [Oedothorax gibbosus]|uniref:Uncharacterized protein n=1 Tax=Oedothorax gibbosus TaxID=931172 RepID=A0AAV6VZ91_9ARAC|nr:hypothetical protein JTE90_027413 [Oedothorax gibbosus]